MSSSASVRLRRVAIIAAGLLAWFVSQRFIGARAMPDGESLAAASAVLTAGDALLAWSAPVNAFLHASPQWANALLVFSSLVIDGLTLMVLWRSISGPSMRPFVGLLILFGLRQMAQVMVALPPPSGMIWHDPGVPSLLVTYGVANDFFFSGHTALAVYGAVELARSGRRGVVIFGVFLALFEIAAVLVLRAHYSMDVFTGAITALWAVYLGDRVSQKLGH